MSATTPRRPAISRTTSHPADAIPDRPAAVRTSADEAATTAAPPSAARPVHQSPPGRTAPGERMTEQHNVRIRPSVKERLGKAVDKMRYETGDRSISIASITDTALDEYLSRYGC